VLAGEPPIDWNAIKTEAEVRDVLGSGARERSMAAVVEREVLARKRRALLLYGTTHLLHNLRGGGVNLYEQHYPGLTLVIDAVVGCSGRGADRTQELERRMSGWPVPSLAFIANTSLTTLDDPLPSPFGRWSQSVDAVLYLGPTALLLRQPMPAHLLLDSTSMSEMRRRATIPTAASDRAKDLLDAAKILSSEANPFLCG
jgi:hypothetical protein